MAAQQLPATMKRKLRHDHDAYVAGTDPSSTQELQHRTERFPSGKHVIHDDDGRASRDHVAAHLKPRLLGSASRDM